jgi:hypothetical protein
MKIILADLLLASLEASLNRPLRLQMGDHPLDKSLGQCKTLWWTLRVTEVTMRRLNDYSFYELGTKLEPLARVQDATKYGSVWFQLSQARDAVELFLENFPLEICRTPAKNLIDTITDTVPRDFNEASTKSGDEPLSYHAYYIRTRKTEFEAVLSAELSAFDTYFLTQQGIYKTSDLVERAEMAFGEETRKNIGDDAKKDFRQGGRCLAFELPTAAGFHTIRAVESVLRKYHRIVRKLADTDKSPEMAQCINELRSDKEDPKVLDILDHVRDLHRNPHMHPEAFLSMEEALRLFDVSKSAINAMADRIAALSPRTVEVNDGSTVSELLGLAGLGHTDI